MATARNPITGQLIKTGHNSAQFQEGYDRIFGDKKKKQKELAEQQANLDVEEPAANEESK